MVDLLVLCLLVPPALMALALAMAHLEQQLDDIPARAPRGRRGRVLDRQLPCS